MIPYTGEPMHEKSIDFEPCWASRNDRECGEPASILGLCVEHYVLLGGERPVMPIPSPESEASRTGAGRR